MTKRRGFLKRLGQVCVIVALAPRIAFKDSVKVPCAPDGLIWRSNNVGIRQQLIDAGKCVEKGPLDLDEFFRVMYQIKKAREK